MGANVILRAIAKIDELLDIASDNGLVFAHKFAHLAFFHLSAEYRDWFSQLYEAACAIGYASTTYGLSNIDEFFAVSYSKE